MQSTERLAPGAPNFAQLRAEIAQLPETHQAGLLAPAEQALFDKALGHPSGEIAAVEPGRGILIQAQPPLPEVGAVLNRVARGDLMGQRDDQPGGSDDGGREVVGRARAAAGDAPPTSTSTGSSVGNGDRERLPPTDPRPPEGDDNRSEAERIRERYDNRVDRARADSEETLVVLNQYVRLNSGERIGADFYSRLLGASTGLTKRIDELTGREQPQSSRAQARINDQDFIESLLDGQYTESELSNMGLQAIFTPDALAVLQNDFFQNLAWRDERRAPRANVPFVWGVPGSENRLGSPKIANPDNTPQQYTNWLNEWMTSKKLADWQSTPHFTALERIGDQFDAWLQTQQVDAVHNIFVSEPGSPGARSLQERYREGSLTLGEFERALQALDSEAASRRIDTDNSPRPPVPGREIVLGSGRNLRIEDTIRENWRHIESQGEGAPAGGLVGMTVDLLIDRRVSPDRDIGAYVALVKGLGVPTSRILEVEERFITRIAYYMAEGIRVDDIVRNPDGLGAQDHEWLQEQADSYAKFQGEHGPKATYRRYLAGEVRVIEADENTGGDERKTEVLVARAAERLFDHTAEQDLEPLNVREYVQDILTVGSLVNRVMARMVLPENADSAKAAGSELYNQIKEAISAKDGVKLRELAQAAVNLNIDKLEGLAGMIQPILKRTESIPATAMASLPVRDLSERASLLNTLVQVETDELHPETAVRFMEAILAVGNRANSIIVQILGNTELKTAAGSELYGQVKQAIADKDAVKLRELAQAAVKFNLDKIPELAGLIQPILRRTEKVADLKN